MTSVGIVQHAVAIGLVICRVGGFFVLSPIPGAWVPQRFRAFLALVLGLLVGVSLGVTNDALQFDLNLLPVAAKEAAIGGFIGGAFRLVIIAAEFCASLIAQASWLSAPSSMNPDFGGQTQALGQVAIMLALLLALGAGVHRTVLAYLLESFRVLPVGSDAAVASGVPPFLTLVSRSFDVGTSLAFPVLGISLAVQTALALISRVAPSLQLFSIGFAILIGSGIITFIVSMPAIADGLLDYFRVLPGFLDDVLLRLVEI